MVSAEADPPVVQAARSYVRQGWRVIPIPAGRKGPQIRAWQDLVIDEAGCAARFAPGSNIGIVTGAVSGGLVDVDLDCAGALKIADYFLPATGLVSGHARNPSSHRWYACDPLAPSEKFCDVRDKATVLVEYRADRRQTVVPPSVHPDGVPYVWARSEPPLRTDGRALLTGVRRLAAALQLAVAWPAKGTRHDAALALAGMLARAEWPFDDAETFVGAVALAAGDEQYRDRQTDVKTTYRAIAEGAAATGLPTLAGIVGDDVVAQVQEWLGIEPAVLVVSPSKERPAEPARPAPTLDGIISAADLMKLQLPPTKWALKGLLPEGATLLVGPPKSYKSWLALQIGTGIAAGIGALGHEGEGGDVLYLCLEDTQRRLQDRFEKQLNGVEPPARFFLAPRWAPFDQGGLEKVERWCETYPQARMVIIDTLQKVRPAQKRNGSVYQEDYDAIAQIKERVADRFAVAVLIIHHTRKALAADPFESSSGSNGLTGAADTVIRLTRPPNEYSGTFYLRGRDVEEQELALSFEPETMQWKLLGQARQIRMSREREQVLEVLREAGEALTPKEIAVRANKKQDATRYLLFRMVRDEQVVATGTGRYTPCEPASLVSANAANGGVFGRVDQSKNARKTVSGAPLTVANGANGSSPADTSAVSAVSAVSDVRGVSAVSDLRAPSALRCDVDGCALVIEVWRESAQQPGFFMGTCPEGHTRGVQL